MLLSRQPRFSILLLAISCWLPYGCATSISDQSIVGLSIPTTTPTGAPEKIPAQLLKPAGTGPFPAIVIMHDCSGVGPRSSGAPERWGNEFVAWGYVVLIPDSFSTRGFPRGVCTDLSPGRLEVGPPRRVSDAYAALAYVRTLPYVDGASVGLMGGSHGGATTLASMAAAESNSDSRAKSASEPSQQPSLYIRGVAVGLAAGARRAPAKPDRSRNIPGYTIRSGLC